MAPVLLLHTYAYSFTDPSAAQVGLNVEFILSSPIKTTALLIPILRRTPKKWNFEWQAAYEMSSSQELNFLRTGKQDNQIGLLSDF